MTTSPSRKQPNASESANEACPTSKLGYGGKPLGFPCALCPEAFRDPGDLWIHAEKHLRRRKYVS